MDRPLGRSIGNALEVVESIECLRGKGPSDLKELVIRFAAEMMLAGGAVQEPTDARAKAERALESGEALDRFRLMIQAQGGDPRVVDRPALLPAARHQAPFRAPRTGVVAEITPSLLGAAVVEMGGGRRRLGDSVDPSVGFEIHAAIGHAVARDERVATVHAGDESGLEIGMNALARALVIADSTQNLPPQLPLVSYRIQADGEERIGAW
jgi:thymidine phosphorylase